MKGVPSLAIRLLTVCALVLSGCIPADPGPTGPLPNAKDIEPNNDTDDAVVIDVDAAAEIEFSGSMGTSTDVDVYDLGPVQEGDRIVVSVRAPSGSRLDPVAALFNEVLDLIHYNDDEDYPNGQYDSFVDHIVRHATNHCYLGITSSGYAPTSGSYTVTLSVTRGGDVPEPVAQKVLLDFDGATVSIPGDRTYTIGAFDASRVDSRLAGRDDELILSVQNELEDRFDGYGVDFYTTSDPGLVDDGTYARLVFGGQSFSTFGLAQSVDHYNQNPVDEAIIFTDGWANAFSHLPTVNDLFTSLGNVAAHEMGHLLGLEHTADVTGLMDSAGTADTILVDQQFKLSILYDEVFPFGWQDAPTLLLDTVGPAVP